jgi:hypothetical protein
MKKAFLGLLLLLPYIGNSQHALSHLSCKIQTGRMTWKMGTTTRNFVWVKQGRKINYYGIDPIKHITLKQAIKKLIENDSKKNFKQGDSIRISSSTPNNKKRKH